MSINLQKISDAINAKISSFDGNSSTTELVKIIESINNVNAHGGVITAPSKNALPLADSSNTGTIAFVRSTGYTDSAGTFYFGTGTDWSMLTTTSDSADSAGAGTVVYGEAAYSFQGSTYGYVSGGQTALNIIEKFSLTVDGNSTDVGDLTLGRRETAGQSSSTHGYTVGGNPSPGQTNVIDKFSFSVDGNATDVGDLTVTKRSHATQNDEFYGWSSGGYTPAVTNIIDKHPFSVDTNASDVGDLTTSHGAVTGQSSTTHGYTSGGMPYTNVIDKFPFASDANATDVGNLTVARRTPGGTSSDVSGYSHGGLTSTSPSVVWSNVIDKFPFASDVNATDVGNLTAAAEHSGGVSSTSHGYATAGSTGSNSTTIQKYSFTLDGNSTNIGDLTVSTRFMAGHQV